MDTLTRRQQQIYDFIRRKLRDDGGAPTLREIAAHFGFRSPRAASDHINALRRKGRVKSERGLARSLRLIFPLQELRNQLADIPIYGSIPAGFANEREQEADGCVSVDIATIGFAPTRNTFAVRVSGDSMIGKYILHGDIVVLEHGQEPRNGDVVAALIDRESTLKTFIRKNGKVYLKAENPKYPDLIPGDEMVIQGVFKALIRKAKE